MDIGDRVPGPVEIGESFAERWADDNVSGDEFRCDGCGGWFPLSQAEPSSISPYSAPVCGSCLQDILGAPL